MADPDYLGSILDAVLELSKRGDRRREQQTDLRNRKELIDYQDNIRQRNDALDYTRKIADYNLQNANVDLQNAEDQLNNTMTTWSERTGKWTALEDVDKLLDEKDLSSLYDSSYTINNYKQGINDANSRIELLNYANESLNERIFSMDNYTDYQNKYLSPKISGPEHKFDEIDYAYSQASAVAKMGYNPDQLETWGDLSSELQSTILKDFPQQKYQDIPDHLQSYISTTSLSSGNYAGLDLLNQQYIGNLSTATKNELQYLTDKKEIDGWDSEDVNNLDSMVTNYDNILEHGFQNNLILPEVMNLGMTALVKHTTVDSADSAIELEPYIDEILSMKNGLFGEGGYVLDYNPSNTYIDDAGNPGERESKYGVGLNEGGVYDRFVKEYLKQNPTATLEDALANNLGPNVWDQYHDANQRANYAAASEYVNLLETYTEQAYKENPMLKVVGLENYLTAMDTAKTNSAYYVKNVLMPTAKVVNGYSQVISQMENGLIKDSNDQLIIDADGNILNEEFYNQYIEAYLFSAQQQYGGAIPDWDMNNRPNVLTSNYNNLANPNLMLNEQDILFLIHGPQDINPETNLPYGDSGPLAKLIGPDETLFDNDLFNNTNNLFDISDKISRLLPEKYEELYGKSNTLTDPTFNDIIKIINQSMSKSNNVNNEGNVMLNNSSMMGTEKDEESQLTVINNNVLEDENLSYYSDGQDYVNNVSSTVKDNPVSLAGFGIVNLFENKHMLPLTSIKIDSDIGSIERLQIQETYNDGDRDKLLYNSATGPNPTPNVADLYLQYGKEGRLESGNAEDIYSNYINDYDFFIPSYNFNGGIQENKAWTHSFIGSDAGSLDYLFSENDWNGQPLYSNNIGFVPFGDITVDELVRRQNEGEWSPHANMSIYASSQDNPELYYPTAAFEPTLGRYLLNWDVTGRPSLVTKSTYESLDSPAQEEYLLNQTKWLKGQGVLGDTGKGAIVEGDMFLKELGDRGYMTADEALDVYYNDYVNFRDNGEEFSGPKVVYMQGFNVGERGFFMPFKEFYDVHIANVNRWNEGITNKHSTRLPLWDVQFSEYMPLYNKVGVRGFSTIANETLSKEEVLNNININSSLYLSQNPSFNSGGYDYNYESLLIDLGLKEPRENPTQADTRFYLK
jgi:hypothetical protein